MKAEELRKIGLSQTEATLYLTLIKLGASDVQALLEETGLYKANIYDSLERLCEKGIVSKIVEGNRRVYQLQKPESLISFIEKKKEDLKDQERIARELAKQVNISKKHLHSPETASVLRGLAGVKQIYSEIVDKRLDYLVFGSPRESETAIGDFYWQNLHLKQKQYNIKAKMIFHKSLRHWKEMVPKDLIHLRFHEEKFEPLTETTIYGSKVAFVIWTENPIVTIINNKHVANSYRMIFELLWKQAKP